MIAAEVETGLAPRHRGAEQELGHMGPDVGLGQRAFPRHAAVLHGIEQGGGPALVVEPARLDHHLGPLLTDAQHLVLGPGVAALVVLPLDPVPVEIREDGLDDLGPDLVDVEIGDDDSHAVVDRLRHVVRCDPPTADNDARRRLHARLEVDVGKLDDAGDMFHVGDGRRLGQCVVSTLLQDSHGDPPPVLQYRYRPGGVATITWAVPPPRASVYRPKQVVDPIRHRYWGIYSAAAG